LVGDFENVVIKSPKGATSAHPDTFGNLGLLLVGCMGLGYPVSPAPVMPTDKKFGLSQANPQTDECNILPGVSWSQKGGNLI
jgi:hypothetical protein